MCSTYSLEIPIKGLYDLFRIPESEWNTERKDLPLRVLPYQQAPVLLQVENKRRLEWMQFSLVPSWSKQARNKFATHNARIESVDEKPSFRDAFVKRHCIVPMTGFVEAIYQNDLAGNMVEFHPPEPKVLYAAAIWDEWLNKETGELLRSFSIITDRPLAYVEKVGHDRSPLFLNGSAAIQWLKAEGYSAKSLKDFLIESRIEPELVTRIERPMRDGWKKRI